MSQMRIADEDCDQSLPSMEYGTFAMDSKGGQGEKGGLLSNDVKEEYNPSFKKETLNLLPAMYWKVYIFP